VGNETTNVVSLSILEEPFFTVRGHDDFKVDLYGKKLNKINIFC